MLAVSISATCSYVSAQTYAPVNLTAKQLVDKADAASGELQSGSYVYVEKSHGGGVDTIATTYVGDAGWIEKDVSGPFTTWSGAYKGTAWEQDENGIVRIRSRFRVKEDPNMLAWQHPEDPRYRVHVLGLSSQPRQEYVIEANPPGGSDQYRYYDAKTFNLDRIVTYAKDRYKHVTEFSDYRTMFGQTRWFHRTYGDGRATNEEVEDVVSFARDTSARSLQIPESRSLFDLPAGAAPVTLPARFTRYGIIVRVTIGGRGLDFLLDSGAADILLDPGVAHELGITPYGRSTTTIGGNFDTSLAQVPDMQIGGLKMRNVAITLGPMSDQTEDARVVGLLGYDFIASSILGIDFKKETVTVYPRSAFAPQTLGVQPMHMMLDDGVPRVPAAFESVSGWFLLDTGAFATLLYDNYVAKLPDKARADVPIDSVSAVGGDVAVHAFSLGAFLFGPVLFKTAVVLVPSESTFDMTDYDGIIGRDALSVYTVWLDYATQTAYLRYNN